MAQLLTVDTNPAIVGLGMAVPSNCVHGAELEDFNIARGMNIHAGWIEERTGIETRYWVDDERTSDLATQAAHRILANAQIDGADITSLFIGTMTSDTSFAVAEKVRQAIGAREDCFTFDYNAACAGGVIGLRLAAEHVIANPKARVLVIGAETMSLVTDITEKATFGLFADAAAGAVVQGVPDAAPIHFSSRNKPNATPPAMYFDEYVRMPNGRYVAEAATTVMAGLALGLAAEIGAYNPENGITDWQGVDYVVPHQANMRLVEALYRLLAVPKAKRVYSGRRYGNVTAASVPLALTTLAENGSFQQGDRVLMTSIGAAQDGFIGAGGVMSIHVPG